MLRNKSGALNAYIRKEGSLKITSTLPSVEVRNEHNWPQAPRMTEIVKMSLKMKDMTLT